jgi:hypothetical protein
LLKKRGETTVPIYKVVRNVFIKNLVWGEKAHVGRNYLGGNDFGAKRLHTDSMAAEVFYPRVLKIRKEKKRTLLLTIY